MKIAINYCGGLAAPKIMQGFARAFSALGNEVFLIPESDISSLPDIDLIMGYSGAGCIALPGCELGGWTIAHLLGARLVQYWADDYYTNKVMPLGKIYQSDRGCTQKWREAGVKVDYLPLATDPDVFRIIPAHKAFNVVISGTPSPPRLAILETLAEFEPAIFGPRQLWEKYPQWMKYYQGCVIGEEELNKLYNLTRVLVDISSPQNLDSANFTVFNGLASGCVLITNYKPALDELFRPEDPLVVYGNLEELHELTARILAASDAAQMMLAQAQRESILDRHTFKQRAERILAELESCPRLEMPETERAQWADLLAH